MNGNKDIISRILILSSRFFFLTLSPDNQMSVQNKQQFIVQCFLQTFMQTGQKNFAPSTFNDIIATISIAW